MLISSKVKMLRLLLEALPYENRANPQQATCRPQLVASVIKVGVVLRLRTNPRRSVIPSEAPCKWNTLLLRDIRPGVNFRQTPQPLAKGHRPMLKLLHATQASAKAVTAILSNTMFKAIMSPLRKLQTSVQRQGSLCHKTQVHRPRWQFGPNNDQRRIKRKCRLQLGLGGMSHAQFLILRVHLDNYLRHR